MICSKCGYVSLDTDLFCIKCGNPLRKPEEPVVVAEPEVEEVPDAEPVIEPEVSEEELIEDIPTVSDEAVADVPEETVPNEDTVDEPAEDVPAFEASEPEAAEADQEEPSPEPVEENESQPEEATEAFVPDPFTAAEAAPVKSYFTPSEKVVVPPVETPVPEEPKKAKKTIIPRLEKPLSVWGFLWRTVLFSIPVINIIPLFVFAFAPGINKNSKNYASAILVLLLIGLIIAVCAAFLVFAYTDPTVLHDFILKYFRLSIEF